MIAVTKREVPPRSIQNIMQLCSHRLRHSQVAGVTAMVITSHRAIIPSRRRSQKKSQSRNRNRSSANRAHPRTCLATYGEPALFSLWHCHLYHTTSNKFRHSQALEQSIIEFFSEIVGLWQPQTCNVRYGLTSRWSCSSSGSCRHFGAHAIENGYMHIAYSQAYACIGWFHARQVSVPAPPKQMPGTAKRGSTIAQPQQLSMYEYTIPPSDDLN